MSNKITSYKGFDKNMKCRDFQYEIGKTYKHDGVAKACESGFHACEYPLDVFNYYNPADSVFCVVEQAGELARHNDDSKVASTEITVAAKISVWDICQAAFQYTSSRAKKTKKAHIKKDWSSASVQGHRSSASVQGHRSSASVQGHRSSASVQGSWSSASVQGDSSSASVQGDSSSASVQGNWSSASVQGYGSSASVQGYGSSASVQGDGSSALSVGNECSVSVDADSKESIAAGFGSENKAKASAGNWIVLAHRDSNGVILHIKSAKAGVDIEPDAFYTLDDDGVFRKAEDSKN